MSHDEPLSILSVSESREVIAPHAERLLQCITTAVDRWFEFARVHTALSGPLGPRERAGFIYAHMVDEARRVFLDVAGVVLAESRGFLSIYIEDKAVVRFKKLSAARRSSWTPTRQATRYFGQLTLPGMGEGTRHIAGYQLDAHGIELLGAVIMVPAGRRALYWYPLDGGSQAGADAPTLPIVPLPVNSSERAQVTVDLAKARRRRSKEA
ncbi:MAG: hypothetical protein K8T90_14870 [Planctomycetes bacterium]|nr:hypothetical protein [Planctomycetota bacterium]